MIKSITKQKILEGKKSAFSLLELLVVLAIVAVMMSLGITSLVELRNRTMLKQSVDNLIQNFNTVRNAARNSVIDRGQVTTSTDPDTLRTLDKDVLAQADQMDYYAIALNPNGNDDDYYKGSCKASPTIPTNYTCTFASDKKLKGSAYDSVKIKVNNHDNTNNNCDTIIFNMGKGNIGFLNSTAEDGPSNVVTGFERTATSTGTPAKCTINFSFKNNNTLSLNVEIDKASYDFNIL